ncbi:ferritin-like domain-containing protein [Azospirillum oryzae]|uniref:Ferritin-like domain-containing protein n=1 Tax=Azospirillum oryzae TaxID=286727 RepID=A0A6N1AM76_9PROT|nr:MULTISPECIES: ferritin-like domain-containing protein [Azospirillum]KAA0570658.1 ferritin-like domain-containing protein [Azospirillum sp. Sh1]KAA0591212.1 ferritin-like domain-containing protein [Azospirillum oryzae]QKS52499.1 ferritin-like domain-containing protein [Azospirillum oryzae]GLR80595.1 YciE/YciF family protein [Azospirillum oryzae]
MAAKTMQDLLIEDLRDIYHAEKQIAKALPKMARAASSDQLRKAFETHLEQTNGQIERLQQVFEEMDTRPRGKHCDAMEGLISEAQEILEMGLAPEVQDAALIAAAQKVEHYEIASYGTLHAYATACGLDKVAQLLNETLQEEKDTDMLLNKLAIGDVNKKAIAASGKKAA